MDGNWHVIFVCGVGLNDEGQIVINTEDDEEEWFVPDEFTHAYLKLYKFVANNLEYAKDKL